MLDYEQQFTNWFASLVVLCLALEVGLGITIMAASTLGPLMVLTVLGVSIFLAYHYNPTRKNGPELDPETYKTERLVEARNQYYTLPGVREKVSAESPEDDKDR